MASFFTFQVPEDFMSLIILEARKQNLNNYWKSIIISHVYIHL